MNKLIVDGGHPDTDLLVRELETLDPGGFCCTVKNASDALRRAGDGNFDIVFLDVDAGGWRGVDLAWGIKQLLPRINIIFMGSEPAVNVETYRIYPSGYLERPVRREALEEALENLRYPVSRKPGKKVLRVRCFGTFEVYCGSRPVVFRRGKTKELLAYLIDRRGDRVSMGELRGILWEDDSASDARKSYLRVLIQDLRTTLDGLGLGDAVRKEWNSISVNPDLICCDYYRYLRGDPDAVGEFRGVYMEQYSWAEMSMHQFLK